MQPKPARHIIRAWLRLWGFHGIVLPPWGIFILAEHMHDDRLIRHERVHWAQYLRMGAVRFYATYLWQVLRYGYRNAPLEREARGEI